MDDGKQIAELIAVAKTNCFAQLIACLNVFQPRLPFECHPRHVNASLLHSLDKNNTPCLIACRLQNLDGIGHAFGLIALPLVSPDSSTGPVVPVASARWSLVQACQGMYELKRVKGMTIDQVVQLLDACDRQNDVVSCGALAALEALKLASNIIELPLAETSGTTLDGPFDYEFTHSLYTDFLIRGIDERDFAR